MDYPHGTGHGVGYFLNVHEGPQSISKNNKVNAKLYLSNEVSKIEDNSYETIFLPDQNSSIDLTKTLIEILIVEKPLKNLCFSLCKGLCSSCGKNLNHETCSCIK